ncbi:hypothetical protein ADICYQ_2717 [Cyclobacterium qasimii M12-11B]|uniref:Outer membrane protein beta-barrel domain-containing protein n=3 Tax=Cyclobacterium qasimii TaxID=1350429 RepID=S7VFE5_9BACT|nr:hypothetical protein ADICYQ_2717 [Cyclobacterium qasimii M12-11B]GEO19819.1 hypothetical protein CQA01_03530 [Cyclobacterium qasimii]
MLSFSAFSQKDHLSSQAGRANVGIGVGLPYGGIGLRMGTNVAKGVNLFGGVGYQIADIGYNLGIIKDFESKGMAQFYLSGMVGTNAAIKIDGLPQSSKTYFGPSLGTGIKLNSNRKEGNFWDMGIIIPIRSSVYKSDLNGLKQDARITGLTEPWPVLLVFAYNFNL